MLDKKLLSIYLNDHLAGATAGTSLAQRAAKNNEGTELGDFLRDLHRDISSDREELKGIMKSLGVKFNYAKTSVAWTAERLGRLKPNGQVRGYSALSRLVELEGLCVGIEGKLALWRSLQDIAGVEAALDAPQLDRLVQRATTQKEQVEVHRLRASRQALTGS
jgi:hypothetical protein